MKYQKDICSALLLNYLKTRHNFVKIFFKSSNATSSWQDISVTWWWGGRGKIGFCKFKSIRENAHVNMQKFAQKSGYLRIELTFIIPGRVF